MHTDFLCISPTTTHPLVGSQNWIQVFNYGLRLTYTVVLAILLFKFKQFTYRVDKVHVPFYKYKAYTKDHVQLK